MGRERLCQRASEHRQGCLADRVGQVVCSWVQGAPVQQVYDPSALAGLKPTRKGLAEQEGGGQVDIQVPLTITI